MQYLIGVDLGTSATKTVLFDEAGRQIAQASESYPLYCEQNGWAEQDPQDWSRACQHTIAAVLSQSGIDPASIAGVGISGQMHGLVMLDAEGQVIRRAIIWCDQRSAAECDQITDIVGRERLIELTANPALPGFTLSKLLWVRKHEPHHYERCRHILLPKDYVRYVLTGELATEVSDASGMQMLDVKNRCWSDELLHLLDIDRSLLAKVYESPEVTGRITRAAAAATGLAEGTIVVGGAGDNAAAAVGTGTVTDGSAFTTIGSSGVVYAHTSRMHFDPEGRVHTFCCAVPGCWHVMGVTQAAGLSLSWFKRELGEGYSARAAASGTDVYALMDNDAKDSPIGANRLLYLPYLCGERTPHLDAECRGAFVGLSSMHVRGDLVRAVMEGVGYSLRDCYEILSGMGVSMQTMTAVGGGARSALWRQMLADLYRCELRTVNTAEGPAMGAAILAGVGACLFSDVASAAKAWIKPVSTCAPCEQDAQRYDSFYAVYRSLYPALRTSFHALASL